MKYSVAGAGAFETGQAATGRPAAVPTFLPAGSVVRSRGTLSDGRAVAECACAEGALYAQRLAPDGAVMPFRDAYPEARAWLRRLAG